MTLHRRLWLSFAAILALLAVHATVYVLGSLSRERQLHGLHQTLSQPGAEEELGRIDAAVEAIRQRDHAIDVWLLATYAVAGLSVLLLSIRGLRHVTQGFRALRHGASIIVDGDRPATVPDHGHDEFAALGKVLNSLSHDLALSQRQLTITNRELEKRNRELDEQRRISDTLLRNILPGDVADELSANGKVTPQAFDDVTILFTDFVGFTPSTEDLDAVELVRILHEYFTDFDQIARRYRLEKLKTIGDSYMCVGGLPRRTRSHPIDAILAALEMVEVVRQKARSPRVPGWDVRVGIHTGSVIAGVVGIDKFAFDVWGKTVNFSSRVEATGLPNRINVSVATHARARDFFDFEPRGKVRTKENREYEMYFVTGIRPELLDPGGQTPPEPFARRYREHFERDLAAFPAFLCA